MGGRVRQEGNPAFVSPRATYATAGAAVPILDKLGKPIRSASVDVIVYSGDAVVRFGGEVVGFPGIELPVGAYSFPIQTDQVFLAGAGVQATGTINTDSVGTGVLPADGENVVLDDGGNPAVTFEFDTDSSVVEINTLRAVDISAAADEDDVKNALIAAINNAPDLAIVASDGGAGLVDLVNQIPGTAGNVAITESVTNANFTVTGMAGGTTTNADVGFVAGVAV